MDVWITEAAAREWVALQNLYERYEFGTLAIKLVAVVLFFAGVALDVQGEWLALVMAVLWLQEGIFKTFQGRLGVRLQRVEQMLAAGGGPAGQAFQLHTAWQAGRDGVAALVVEYARSAARPTVAFPYAVLLLVAWFWLGG